jgi:phospholipid/cholesterol/gamma-HCH transport system ATP-binding protein
VIRLSGVSKSFGSNTVLRGLDLAVAEGTTLAVIGRSGTGKSVLLKCVARLLRVDDGNVRVGDVEVVTADEPAIRAMRSRMGYVFQFAALFDSMRIGDNIEAPLRREGVPPAEARQRSDEVLELVGLAGTRDQFPSELSGGMRKRAGIARAVVSRPDYLLYDEPTTGLDPVTTAVIDDLMLRLKHDMGATGIVVTHDIRSACNVADRVALLHEGRIHFEGTPDELQSSEDRLVRSFIDGRPDLWPDETSATNAGEKAGGPTP